jgi:hypothetical protein
LKVKQTNIGGLYSIALIAFLLGLSCIITLYHHIGTWGLNKTVGWAWDTNFVWWVGIGHAGTFLQYYYFSVSDGEWP